MGYPLTLARRYLESKKRNMISISTALAVFGVTLGVAALAIVMSVTAGFKEEFRSKVLGVNAHVLVLKDPFRNYREMMDLLSNVKDVEGISPFLISPTMVTHGKKIATGVLLKGVDPVRMQRVLDLPEHIVQPEGSEERKRVLDGLRRPDAKPFEQDPSHDSFDVYPPPEDEPLRRDSIFEALRETDARSRDAGAPSPSASATAPPPSRLPPAHEPSDAGAARGPAGDVTPDGGYQSVLPDADVLPTEIAPEPCSDSAEVVKLPGVIVGETLAKNLGLTIGTCVEVVSPVIGFGFGSHPPVAKQFRVIAVFSAGFDQYDAKLMYADLYEAQPFYGHGDAVMGLEMKVAHVDDAKDVAEEISGIVGPGSFRVMDWEELNHGLFTALLLQQIVMSSVLALIILVAAFTVIATLIMVVLEKKKEIAILKALGAKDSAVLRVFLYQGGIIGALGTTFGLLLGVAGCLALRHYQLKLDAKVYFISELPVAMHPSHFVVTGAIAILICLAGTIFPARYAARLRPSDGLRAG